MTMSSLEFTETLQSETVNHKLEGTLKKEKRKINKNVNISIEKTAVG